MIIRVRPAYRKTLNAASILNADVLFVLTFSTAAIALTTSLESHR